MSRPSHLPKLDWNEIQIFYDSGKTTRDIVLEFKTTPTTIARASASGKFKPRSASESMILSRKNSPRTLTQEHKQRLREVMLERRANGYNWSFAHSKQNQDAKSYPETFFTEVIANEFDDKIHEFNMPFHRFSLDFAWPDKKKVIEIDGEQHYTDKDQIVRDKAKDALLAEEGWEVLRIRWKTFFKDPKPLIKQANEFIGLSGRDC